MFLVLDKVNGLPTSLYGFSANRIGPMFVYKPKKKGDNKSPLAASHSSGVTSVVPNHKKIEL